MSKFRIKIFPDSVLRRVCTPVRKVDQEIWTFVDDLSAFMERQPGGIGIAAPQVGVRKQIAIVDVSPKVAQAQRIVLINPKITQTRGRRLLREGCMSLPDYTANVLRWVEIEVEYMNLDGKILKQQATGIEAICIQHEIDHLNGLLFIDRVGCLKSDVFRRKRYL
jgi:peptide deformylase